MTGAPGRRPPPDPHETARRHGDGHAPRAGEEALFVALERTRADLADAPSPAPPEGLVSRMQAAIAAERGASPPTDGPLGSPAPPPRGRGPVEHGSRPAGPRPARPRSPGGRNRDAPERSDLRGVTRPGRRPDGRRSTGIRSRRVLAGGLLALALVASVVAGLTTLTGPGAGTAPSAAPSRPPVEVGPGITPSPSAGTDRPIAVSGADPVRALRRGLGARDPGPLSDPARRAACLGAHDLPAATVAWGSRQVVVDGAPGTLLVLPTGQAARFRLLVVGPGCAPGSPSTLLDVPVGG